MKIEHDCDTFVSVPRSADIAHVKIRKRCEVCGQRWVIDAWPGGGQGVRRQGGRGLKGWLWQRRAKKRMKEERND